MPAERRTFTSARPVKTERTHEENQERAYIAASRRSDRSLEARIESARRASEIHKKRTGRALRVTEQDVINEEMYEEEDDDLPTQYQRLNAHLHTTSVMFNKKLHDYIATQHGVRNMFMSQYNNPQQQFAAGQYPPNAAAYPQPNNWLSPAMLPPQQFSPATPQGFQHAQPYSPAAAPPQQQQGFRHSPYHVPQRSQPHQRSMSIQMPPAANFEHIQQPHSGATTPRTEADRRMSLPLHALEHQTKTSVDAKARPALSQSPTVRTSHQRHTASPQSASPESASVEQSPRLHSDTDTSPSFTYGSTNYPYGSQVLNTNPLSMSLPPESQQLIGSALDPNDPRTAMFMAGSDNLPQPFAATYTYNPNLLKTRAPGSAQTLSSGLSLKLEPDASPSTGFYNNDSFLTPGNGDYNTFFDFQGSNYAQPGDEHGVNDQLDGNNFVNWD